MYFRFLDFFKYSEFFMYRMFDKYEIKRDLKFQYYYYNLIICYVNGDDKKL